MFAGSGLRFGDSTTASSLMNNIGHLCCGVILVTGFALTATGARKVGKIQSSDRTDYSSRMAEEVVCRPQRRQSGTLQRQAL
jgi:hypothetical protein